MTSPDTEVVVLAGTAAVVESAADDGTASVPAHPAVTTAIATITNLRFMSQLSTGTLRAEPPLQGDQSGPRTSSGALEEDIVEEGCDTHNELFARRQLEIVVIGAFDRHEVLGPGGRLVHLLALSKGHDAVG